MVLENMYPNEVNNPPKTTIVCFLLDKDVNFSAFDMCASIHVIIEGR